MYIHTHTYMYILCSVTGKPNYQCAVGSSCTLRKEAMTPAELLDYINPTFSQFTFRPTLFDHKGRNL